MTRNTAALIALAALSLSATAPAVSAQTLHDGYSHDPSKIVTYTRIDRSDIDANSAAGARLLLQRIEVAANAVCGGADSARTPRARAAFMDCRDDAIRGAVSKMGSKPLSQLAAGQRREQLATR